MGLGELEKEDFKEEEKALNAIGIDVSPKVDKEIDEYFYDKGLAGKVKCKKLVEEAVKGVLSVSTEGFIDGELQHNMPCPVCLNTQAKYINDGKDHYFAPCESCASKGFVLKKAWWSL